jgi:hypothetical protein
MDQIKKRIACISLLVMIGSMFCIGYHCGSNVSLVGLSIEHECIVLLISLVFFISAIDLHETDKYM